MYQGWGYVPHSLVRRTISCFLLSWKTENRKPTRTHHHQFGPSFTGFLQGEVGGLQLLSTDEDNVVSPLLQTLQELTGNKHYMIAITLSKSDLQYSIYTVTHTLWSIHSMKEVEGRGNLAMYMSPGRWGRHMGDGAWPWISNPFL